MSLEMILGGVVLSMVSAGIGSFVSGKNKLTADKHADLCQINTLKLTGAIDKMKDEILTEIRNANGKGATQS